jgi:hypothetical protein
VPAVPPVPPVPAVPSSLDPQPATASAKPRSNANFFIKPSKSPGNEPLICAHVQRAVNWDP